MRAARLALGFAAPLVLAACATGVPVERQVVVPGSGFSAVQGEAALVVRTFLPDSGGERREVLGARCAVVSSLYTTELVTPARLVVPNFGPQSPALSFDCAADELTGRATVEIVTNWQYAPGAWGYPYGGPYAPYAAYAGWGWYGGPGYPVSEYPNVAVILR